MKRLLIILAIAIFSINCMGQRKDSNNVAVVQYPQRLKQLTRTELNDYANKRFKKGSWLFNTATRRPVTTSVVDDIIFDVNMPREYHASKSGETAADHVNGIKANMGKMRLTRHILKL